MLNFHHKKMDLHIFTCHGIFRIDCNDVYTHLQLESFVYGMTQK